MQETGLGAKKEFDKEDQLPTGEERFWEFADSRRNIFPVAVIDYRELERGCPIRTVYNIGSERFEKMLEEARNELLDTFPFDCYPGSREKAIVAIIEYSDNIFDIKEATIYCQGYMTSDTQMAELQKKYRLITICG